ncbi:hypothetical protein [Baekduia sp. Peel2402]|uniref:hypothetical protein n=1 Tax=Baekduia sp. Peel2402 TaxID=3458296 RepID=UPI00403E762F
MRRRLALGAAAGSVVAAVVLPASAQAHGLAGRTDLPVPGWIFTWAAAVVLVASFVALSTLWQTPRLEGRRSRAVARIPPVAEPLAGALGVLAFAGLVYSGLAGSQEPLANILPTFVFVVFWVVIPVLSVVLGDVFRPLNPWRAVGRLVVRRPAPLTYPRWLGRWPAAVGLLAFAWLELVCVTRDDPSLLAWLAIAYMSLQLIGMALFGVATWCERADAFGVYFGIAARLAPLEVRDRRLRVRPVLSGLTALEPLPGTVAVVCVLIGSTSFDGAANGLWKQVGPSITRGFAHLGAGPDAAAQLAGTVGLLAAVLLVGGARARRCRRCCRIRSATAPTCWAPRTTPSTTT